MASEATDAIQHTHRYHGQVLRHRHEGGDQPHGYFEHPEDLPAPQLAGRPFITSITQEPT